MQVHVSTGALHDNNKLRPKYYSIHTSKQRALSCPGRSETRAFLGKPLSDIWQTMLVTLLHQIHHVFVTLHS